MAVYTHLTDEALRQHLRPFRIGELIRAKGVSAGTINTVYDITTTRGHFILRILEDRSPTDARFEEALLLHLAERDLLVPRMVAGRRGCVVPIAPRQQLSVFEYLPGRELGVFEVRPAHAQQVGTFLAEMHLAARDLGRRRRNRFAPERIARIADLCLRAAKKAPEQLNLQDVDALRGEVKRHQWSEDLPRGIIHGDLFIDNVRFSRGKLSGVLDFEMASTGPLAYDLAVALCDWSFYHDRFDLERGAALVAGYQEKRPLTSRERSALYELCRFATARFALTRFYDFEVRSRPDANRLYKDYQHFMRRLVALKGLGVSAFRAAVLEGTAAGAGARGCP